MKIGKLFVISAPSGTGKTTLVEALLKRWGKEYNLKKAITYTTRSPREGEVDGIDYHFVSIEEFNHKVQEGFFMEWSSWYDNYYGSSIDIIEELKKGVSYILIIDRIGASKIAKEFPHSILIWIEPLSIDVLEERLRLRGKDSESSILNRLKKASIEIEEEKKKPMYTYHFINNMFEETLKNIINVFKKHLKP